MKPSRYHNLSIEQIDATLASINVKTAANIRKAADLLMELWNRGERRSAMREGVLKWFREIAEEKIAVSTAMIFCGYHSLMKRLATIPLDVQLSLTNSATVVVAEHNDKGEIVPAEKSLFVLTQRETHLAFSENGFRPFAQQKKLLAEMPKQVRTSKSPTRITYDPKKEELIIGLIRVSMNDIAKAVSKYFLVERRN